MATGQEDIRRLLRALSEKMDFYACQPLGIVVCGGAALNVMGVLDRPTRDVDVIALASTGKGPLRLSEATFPEEVRRCVHEVAADFGESQAWLHCGPAEIFRKGLPQGMEQRLSREDIGSRLRVYWVSRLDLICMKLYAAASRSARPEPHAADLRALRPDGQQLERAREWALTQDDSEEFKQELRRTLIDMGHSDLAYGW
jgi:hypothetical protein